jgi:hypothetical protein
VFFCCAVAFVSAAIADPLVEAASNAGWFGPGVFTDRSTLDVVPVLLAGVAFCLLYLVVRVRGILRSSKAALGSSIAVLLPLTFAIQIVLLYGMETTEQVVVWGHVLGGTIWLGGPVLVSLAAHAVICAAIAFAAIRPLRLLATTAAGVIRLIRALATLTVRSASPIALRHRNVLTFDRSAFALCSVGERAPPLPLA